MGYFKDFKEDFSDTYHEVVLDYEANKSDSGAENAEDDLDVESELSKLEVIIEKVAAKRAEKKAEKEAKIDAEDSL